MSLFDLFLPQWKKSDPDVRLRAVREMRTEQQDLLRDVARKDADPRVRRAALQKIDDLDALVTVERTETDPEIKAFLRQKISAGALRLLKTTADPSRIDLWFPRVRDNSALETLLQNAALPEIRLLCAEKTNREQALAHAARQDNDERVASAALAKVSKEEFLSEIARSARHDSVRAEAARRLDEIARARSSERETQLAARRVSALKATLRRYAEEFHLAAMEESVLELVAEAKAMAASEGDAELDELAKRIEAKLEAERNAQAKLAAQAALEREQRSRLEEILADLQSLVHLAGAPDEARARFEELRRRWADGASEVSQSVLARLAPRFDETSERILALFGAEEEKAERARAELKERLRAEKERAESEARKKADEARAAFKAKLDALEELVAKVRDLDPETEFDGAVEKLREYRKRWNEIVGDEREKFGKAWKRFRQAASAFQEVEEWEQWHNQREKEALVEEAEALAGKDDEKTIVAEVERLKRAWRNAGSVAREKHEALRERFGAAVDAALSKCAGYLRGLEEEKARNLELKKAMLEEIRSFVETTAADGAAAREMKAFQDKWRAVGQVPSAEENEALWAEYRKLTSAFFEKRRERMKEEKTDRLAALELKTRLCEEAEALSGSAEWSATAEKFKALQERWKAIGPVPRKDSDAIWARFRAACDLFFDAKRDHFEALDETRRKNLAAKGEICDRLEALGPETDGAVLAEALRLAREEWKAIGAVPRKDADAVQARFRDAQDRLVDAARAASPEFRAATDAALERKRALLERARAVAGSNDWNATAKTLAEIRGEWAALDRAGSAENPLSDEFDALCDGFFSRRREQFEIQEQSRLNNLDRKMVLVEQAERLAARGPGEEARREAKMMRRQWKEIGPVPRKESERIWERFNAACNALFEDKESSDD